MNILLLFTSTDIACCCWYSLSFDYVRWHCLLPKLQRTILADTIRICGMACSNQDQLWCLLQLHMSVDYLYHCHFLSWCHTVNGWGLEVCQCTVSVINLPVCNVQCSLQLKRCLFWKLTEYVYCRTWLIICLIYLGIKLVIELIPNHTSRRHKWFVQSRQSANNPFSDFYIWDNGRRFENGTRYPPNNWVINYEHYMNVYFFVHYGT